MSALALTTRQVSSMRASQGEYAAKNINLIRRCLAATIFSGRKRYAEDTLERKAD